MPSDATTNQTFARFRWSTTAGLDATTAATDGEVEDYALTIQPYAITASNGVMRYADSGTGAYTSEIAWLDWAGTSLDDGLHTGDQVTFPNVCGTGSLTATFSNITNTTGAAVYTPADMQTWSGASVFNLYNTAGSGEVIYTSLPGGAQPWTKHDIAAQIDFSWTLNGQTVSPDLIFVDAETTAINTATPEMMQAITNGGNWSLIENAVGTDYIATGVGTQTITMTDTEQPGHSPILLTENATRLNITSDVHGKQGFADNRSVAAV